MSRLSDAHGFRKTIAGACMVLAPLLLLAASIVSPKVNGTGEGKVLAVIGAHADRFYLSTVLAIAGLVLLLPAVLGLMHMLRERRVAFGHVGGAFTLTGLLTLVLFTGVGLMQWQMVRGGAARDQMVALLHRFDHTAGTQVFFWLSIAFAIGMIALAAGLYLARALHWSTAGALGAAGCLVEAAVFTNRYWLFIVASAVLLVGFGSVGAMILRETTEEWEHTPEVHGWRTAASH